MNWVDGGELGRCFLFVKGQDVKLEWKEANEYCTERGGYLTDITDQQTFDFISVHHLGNSWIGGSNIDNVSKKKSCSFLTLTTEILILIGWAICMGP